MPSKIRLGFERQHRNARDDRRTRFYLGAREAEADSEADPRDARRYRAMLLDRPIGPWRSGRSEAIVDAIRAGEASVDEHSRNAYLGVFCWIRESRIESSAAA